MQIISFLPVESGVSYRQVEARLAAGAYWRLKISSGLRECERIAYLCPRLYIR